jgi:predicted GNAT family N-acyltransferase
MAGRSQGEGQTVNMVITVRKVANSTEIDQCYLIRMAVFVDEQKVPPWEEMDAFDETADHFAVLVDGTIVGTARLVELEAGTGKIGRVAVMWEHRRAGLGRELMRCVIEEGHKRFETLILDSQVSVIPFYERLGFTADGEVFLDAGIEHQRMVRMRE